MAGMFDEFGKVRKQSFDHILKEAIDGNIHIRSWLPDCTPDCSEYCRRTNEYVRLPMKPCPFCGEEAYAYTVSHTHWHVYCDRCNLKLAVNTRTQKEAVDIWNIRA